MEKILKHKFETEYPDCDFSVGFDKCIYCGNQAFEIYNEITVEKHLSWPSGMGRKIEEEFMANKSFCIYEKDYIIKNILE